MRSIKRDILSETSPDVEQVEAKSAPLAKSVTIADIWEAHKLLMPLLHHTPLNLSHTLHDKTGSEVYLKAENLQRSGSFKVRGASYKMSRLSEQERRCGVITASAGNHAQGVAIAAAQYHIPCTIVMPETAALAKVVATQGYGASVVLHGFTYDDAYQRSLELQAETGATFIHPFDDPDVIAGQGTLGLEMLSDLPDADAVVVPVGGGGLIAGVAIAARALKPNITIIGVQAAGAPTTRAPLDEGEPYNLLAIDTLADGIAVKRPGELTFSIIQRLEDDGVLVDDEASISAEMLLLELSKKLDQIAGPIATSTVTRSAVTLQGKKVLVPLTGGNIDINLVGRFIEHGLADAGRYFVIHTRLTDRPGELMRLLVIISEMRINVIDVRHQRISSRLPIMQREETLTLETRDRAQCEQLLQRLREAGYVVEEAQSL